MLKLTFRIVTAGLLLLAPIPAGAASTVFIDTPDLCSKVQRQAPGKVYLSTDKQCPQIRGKVPVTMEPGGEIEVFVNGERWETQHPADFDARAPGDAMHRAQALAGTIEVPKNVHEKQGWTAAKEVADYSRSDEFRGKVEAESQRIRHDLFGEQQVLEEHYAELKKKKAVSKGSVLASSERIYIFVSSSMPITTLRNYAESIDAMGDPNIFMVMRGMVHGMTTIGPTTQFLGKVLKRDPACSENCAIFLGQVQIDPYLFKRYHVNEVPAVVYVKGVEKEDEEMSEGQEDVTSAGDNYTFLGDASLGYAVNQIAEASASMSVKAVAKKLGEN